MRYLVFIHVFCPAGLAVGIVSMVKFALSFGLFVEADLFGEYTVQVVVEMLASLTGTSSELLERNSSFEVRMNSSTTSTASLAQIDDRAPINLGNVQAGQDFVKLAGPVDLFELVNLLARLEDEGLMHDHGRFLSRLALFKDWFLIHRSVSEVNLKAWLHLLKQGILAAFDRLEAGLVTMLSPCEIHHLDVTAILLLLKFEALDHSGRRNLLFRSICSLVRECSHLSHLIAHLTIDSCGSQALRAVPGHDGAGPAGHFLCKSGVSGHRSDWDCLCLLTVIS